MRLFEKRWFAWVVLILAIAAAVGIGRLRQPANRGYQRYIDDGAAVLSASVEQSLREYDAAWDSKYGACLAVITLAGEPDGGLEDYGYQWGDNAGLTEWDMVLLLAPDSWTVCPGEAVGEYLSDTYVNRLSAAVNGAGSDDDAVRRFCAALDDFYAHGLRRTAAAGQKSSAFPWGRILLVLLAVAVIWIIVDRSRYNRYRRRVASSAPVYGTVPFYYPVFWGRRAATPRPPRAPKPPHGRPVSAPKAPRPQVSRPSRPAPMPAGKKYRVSGGSSGHSFSSSGKSFGGSRGSGHSSFSSSRSSSSGSRSISSGSRSHSSSSRSFSSGSHSSHSFGGSRGGGRSFGGRR